MRVITGKVKGRHLKFPAGTKTRPVTDLVRGAIFSILENLANDWSLVLDLFAGSGALGIEALSRGAGWVDFVENERKCCDIIKENLAATEFSSQSRVYCCNVDKALGFLDKEYNIILMDPPYANPSTGDIITRLAASSLVGAKTTLVVTHAARTPLNQVYASLNLIKEHRHGDSSIAIFQKEAES
ncbi:MAG: 16S rRNA (guanine(966)-N(2))-methyltransferase RsmD [Dehalococcoidales bacterium]